MTSLAIRVALVGTLWVLPACSTTTGLDSGCASCQNDTDCPSLSCTCVQFDGGTQTINGYCSDSCCGSCPPGCTSSSMNPI